MDDKIKNILNQMSKDDLPKIDLTKIQNPNLINPYTITPSEVSLEELVEEHEKKDKREVIMLWSTIVAAVFGILSFIVGIIALFK